MTKKSQKQAKSTKGAMESESASVILQGNRMDIRPPWDQEWLEKSRLDFPIEKDVEKKVENPFLRNLPEKNENVEHPPQDTNDSQSSKQP